MRLVELAGEESKELLAGSMGGIDILGVAADSRRVGEGWLFAALPGGRADGRDFIDEAVARGALAVLAPLGTRLKPYARPVALVTDANPRRRLALMAARFSGMQPPVVAAVTGTNGKTSVASFARQLWSLLGRKAGSMGTLGVEAPDHDRPGSLTTPDPVELHTVLAELARAGIDRVALEASSHGLDQYRLDGVRFRAGAFTNLSRDHLDYHGTMEVYRAAKLRLFAELLPEGAAAVVNADAPECQDLYAIARRRGLSRLSFGRATTADLRLVECAPVADGQRLALSLFGKRREMRFPVVGEFQALNVLCALGLVVACGEEPEAAADAIQGLRSVRGRLELVARTAGASIYVDYAHTPDALRTALQALRAHSTGRLVVVFGCGGDRDRGKRPEMGSIAAALADRVIVTDDNPRGEDPAAIRAEILVACRGAEEVGERAAAIRRAVEGLRAGDVLAIAGKGHETGQTAKGVTHPFDDAVVARAAVAALAERQRP